ncbi:MAG: UvrD-helicase domain-containing protein, partial [Planctomycetota bacterium]
MIKYLLIDEFQDTNPTQEKLFRQLISDSDAPGRFFAVGDAKQAIYGFRRSDVRIFTKFESEIKSRNAALKDQPQQLAWGMSFEEEPADERQAERQAGIVKLVTNYRTVKPTLEIGNSFFGSIFDLPEREDYDPEPQAMQVGNSNESPSGKPVEIHMLQSGGKEEGSATDR